MSEETGMVFTLLAGGPHASEDGGVMTCTLNVYETLKVPSFEEWVDLHATEDDQTFKTVVKEKFKAYIQDVFRESALLLRCQSLLIQVQHLR